MSTNGYTAECPVCGNDMDVLERNRPFPSIDCCCNNCGFLTATEIYRETLDGINDNRFDGDEELITEEEYHKHDNHPLFPSQNYNEIHSNS